MNVERVAALDALRGLAIAAMLLSGQLPQRVLPGWMYHAQNPPPLHAFNAAVPGITWVDLVFPLFLFALGAAIPLALAPALKRGETPAAVVRAAVRRAGLIACFAVYIRHISPHSVDLGEAWLDGLYALAGFALLFPMLARLPPGWTGTRRSAVRATGVAGAALLLAMFRDAQGAGFSWTRSDTIMLVLANVALSGALIWLCTRRRPALRAGLLGFLLALRLCHELPGWGSWLWHASPLPVLAPIAFQQYLFIVIPGTLAGDLLLRLARRPARPFAAANWALAAACLALLASCVTGLYARHSAATLLAVVVLALVIAAVLKRHGNREWRRLFALGSFLMLLGLAFEPYEGGIQKGVATLSYYLVGAGAGCVALLLLLSLQGWRKGAALSPFLGAGQNPMLAYTALHTLVTPVLTLSGLAPVLGRWGAGAMPGVLRALLLAGLVCAIAAWCVRRRLVLRA